MNFYFKNGLSKARRMRGFCFYITPLVCIQRCDVIRGSLKGNDRKTGAYSLHFALCWLFWDICFSWNFGRYDKSL